MIVPAGKRRLAKTDGLKVQLRPAKRNRAGADEGFGGPAAQTAAPADSNESTTINAARMPGEAHRAAGWSKEG
jgi:hypothetical protein